MEMKFTAMFFVVVGVMIGMFIGRLLWKRQWNDAHLYHNRRKIFGRDDEKVLDLENGKKRD